MMKKKLLALILALAMTMSLAACGGKDQEEPPQDNPVMEEQKPDDTLPQEDSETLPEEGETDLEEDAEKPAQKPAEKPAEKPAQKPAEKPAEKPAQKPAQKPAEKPAEKPAQKPAEKPAQKPAQKPAEKPAQKPAEKPAQKQVNLAAFYETLSGGKDWPGMMPVEGEAMGAFYPGLAELGAKQCNAYTATISAAVAEMVLVEVKDSADVQKVKEILQARINYQVGDEKHPGGAWYPETIDGWKNNSRIVSNGNYVMLIAMDGCDTVVSQFNALFA